ncbi:MAG: cupin domain-containing protein [Acidobacteriia bacterium]|nr:cupin domain-containing protein [Terriglobia bacterium]
MPEFDATHRGAARATESTAGPYLSYDLQQQVEELRRESYWQSGRNSKTIVKYSDLRIVLMAIRQGTLIREHHSDGRISVQTVAGRIRLHAAGKEFDLPPGHLLALDRGLRHDVEALEDSAFLLTIAWPEGATGH